MVNNKNILQELQEISAAVATISNRNVYTVPAGYFDALAGEMLAGVQMASRPVQPLPFTVPPGYFDGLAAAVMRKIYTAQPAIMQDEVFEELEEIAPLLNTISKKSPYTVPEGYFEGLAGTVAKTPEVENDENQGFLASALDELPLLLGSVGKKVPYNLPVGYFENFAGSVINSIQQLETGILAKNEVSEELEEIAPVLNTISKKPPYTVPTGYFESLARSVTHLAEVFAEVEQLAPMLNSISKKGPYDVPENFFEQFTVTMGAENQGVKVMPMRPTRTKWMVWLAAACITAVMATGSVLFWQNNGKQNTAVTDISNSLSDVSDTDISNYLNTMPAPGVETIPNSVLDEHVPEVEPVIQNLSSDEIKEYLDNNSDPDEKSQKDS